MFHAVKYMSIYVCSMAKIGYTNIWLTLETQKKITHRWNIVSFNSLERELDRISIIILNSI